uniref:Putative lipocalin-3 1 n=1 Tax=Amblyomma americanum TaxID=6943 RepID=A0A0C9R626_AMBAM
MGEAHFTRQVMAAGQVVLVFISTLPFAAAQAESGNAEAGQEVDIKKFLQKNPKIRVYEATESGNKTCVADYYSAATKTDVEFKRYFTEGTNQSYYPLRGEFGPTQQEQEGRFTKMTVYYSQTGKDDKKLSEETMVYFSMDETCAVFKVEENAENSIPWYDVRISHDSVDLPHTSCLKFYKEKKPGYNFKACL